MAEKLVKALTELKEKEVLDMVQELLESGKKPMEIVDSSRIAMEEVGKRFESGEYFIPDLIFAGEILKRVSEIVKPEMEEEAGAEKIGKVIIGTVEGDIHDIGKNIVTFMMDINGFEVIDLGVDVPPEKYVEAIRENDVKVVGLSVKIDFYQQTGCWKEVGSKAAGIPGKTTGYPGDPPWWCGCRCRGSQRTGCTSRHDHSSQNRCPQQSGTGGRCCRSRWNCYF
jgi:hypothetical protein